MVSKDYNLELNVVVRKLRATNDPNKTRTPPIFCICFIAHIWVVDMVGLDRESEFDRFLICKDKECQLKFYALSSCLQVYQFIQFHEIPVKIDCYGIVTEIEWDGGVLMELFV